MNPQDIETTINNFREVLAYLVESEKARQEEIAALKEQVSSVEDTLVNDVINPYNEAVDNIAYDEFKGKYGDKFAPYEDTLRRTENNPELDATREAYNSFKDSGLGPEDEEEYVNQVAGELDSYISGIKESLGIPSDTAVSVEDDGNGNTEVKVDADGDGEPETPVNEGTGETEAPATESPAEGEASEESEDEDNPEEIADFEKELDDYYDKNVKKE